MHVNANPHARMPHKTYITQSSPPVTNADDPDNVSKFYTGNIFPGTVRRQ